MRSAEKESAMKIFYIVPAILFVFALIFFVSAYVCYRLVFFVKHGDDKANKKRSKNKTATPRGVNECESTCENKCESACENECESACVNEKITLPDTEQYAPYRPKIAELLKETEKLPYEDVYISSDDGLKLHAKYYEAKAGAPLRIMFHGYKSNADLDFCGGLCYSLKDGFNVLLADQRAHGKSEGKCLSFGVKERYDCLEWARYAALRFGKNCKIILNGMSMGAATVLMACGLNLPENVVAVVADCGYTSPEAIVKKVIKDRKYPVRLVYPLVRAGGLIFGGFDIEEASALKAMQVCKIPVFFVHGESDLFVPCDMSRQNYDSCACKTKKLLTIKGAGHGISFMVDRNAYQSALNEFLSSVL